MGINANAVPKLPFPTPVDIANYITAHEIPARSRELPEARVRTVFRYGAIAGSVIHAYDRLERGMHQARLLIEEYEREDRSFPSGMAILAEELTRGKGRFQRLWHAPPGGIWMTLVLVNNLLPEVSRLLPLAAGMACCETARRFGAPALVKWVNDVHVHGRKLAGILMETEYGKRFREEYILIGVGFNVNNRDFPPVLDGLAISMAEVCGSPLDLRLVATDLLAKFSWQLGLLYQQEEMMLDADEAVQQTGRRLLTDRWQELSDTVGRRVRFGYDAELRPQYEAEVVGIDPDGGLKLRSLEDKVVITEYGGEIVYLE